MTRIQRRRRGPPPKDKRYRIFNSEKRFIIATILLCRHQRAEQKREEVGTFSMHNHSLVPVENYTAMLAILGRAGPIPSKPDAVELKTKFTLRSFIPALNKFAAYIHTTWFSEADAIIAKDTDNDVPQSHTTSIICHPDITLAYSRNWVRLEKKGKNNPRDVVSWPCVELVGEKESAGDLNPLRKTLTHIHYWMLARPDRKVALSFLTSASGVVFFVSYHGKTETHTLTLKWGSRKLPHLVFAFIYRLYDPGTWAYEEFTRRTTRHEDGEAVTLYDIEVNGSSFANFKLVYSCNPFHTRTHVFVNAHSTQTVDGKPVTVIKDQLTRNTRRFDEQYIYKKIHGDGPIPGVVQPSLHAEFDNPLVDHRRCQITGLQQYGHSIMVAETLRDVLEILFDILEILRVLYVSRKVLHRDISKGNIMFLKPSVPPKHKTGIPKDFCFIKHLLDPNQHPHETCALLIDFNNAEDLDKQEGTRQADRIRTGTPGFVARAVESNGPIIPKINYVHAIPEAPPQYRDRHPERYAKFPPTREEIVPRGTDTRKDGWRHDLDHDVESVFWVLLYWLISAQPENKDSEPIAASAWACFANGWRARNNFIAGEAYLEAFHPIFEPVIDLILPLTEILRYDRSFLPQNNTRNDPEYTVEAFQRLILRFILDNPNAEFMMWKIDVMNPRVPGKVSGYPTISCTPASFEASEEYAQKRKLELDAQAVTSGQSKRQHLDKVVEDEDDDEDGEDDEDNKDDEDDADNKDDEDDEDANDDEDDEENESFPCKYGSLLRFEENEKFELVPVCYPAF